MPLTPLHISIKTQTVPPVDHSTELLKQAKDQLKGSTALDLEGLHVLDKLSLDESISSSVSPMISPCDLAQFIASAEMSLDSARSNGYIEVVTDVADLEPSNESLASMPGLEMKKSGSKTGGLKSSFSEATRGPRMAISRTMEKLPRYAGAVADINLQEKMLKQMEAMQAQMQKAMESFNVANQQKTQEKETKKVLNEFNEFIQSEEGREMLLQAGFTPAKRLSDHEVTLHKVIRESSSVSSESRNTLMVLQGAVGSAQLGSLGTDRLGETIPGDFINDIMSKRSTTAIHKSAKQVLKSFETPDKELKSIEKLIIKAHEVDAKRYKILDTFLKGLTLTGFTVAGVIAVLGAVGIIGSAAVTICASLVGVPAGIMLAAGVGWFIYKTARNAYRSHKQNQWIETARHEGKHFNKLKAKGMSDAEIDMKVQEKLAAHHPRYAVLTLWDKIKTASVNPEVSFQDANVCQYLKAYGFSEQELEALANVDDSNLAIEVICRKLEIPTPEDPKATR